MWARPRGAVVRVFAVCIALVWATIAHTAEVTYKYDDLGRLIKASYANGETVEYTYDAEGNRSRVATTGVPGPELAIGDALVSEGGDLSFTVSRTGNTAVAFSVDYATEDGNASAGADYTAQSDTLTFRSGQTEQTVLVTTIDDEIHENDETVQLNLTSATDGATIADGQGTGTITDNDAVPSFSVNDVSASEGGELTFTITKSGQTVKTHSVSYATADGTASEGEDYTGESGTLSFGPTQTAQTVAVRTIDDGIGEEDETVQLNLASATDGATIADEQGIGTITDQNAPPSFSVNDVSASEGDELTFTVTLSGEAVERHTPIVVFPKLALVGFGNIS